MAPRVLHILEWPGFGGIESIVISLLLQQPNAGVLFLRNGPGLHRFLKTRRIVRFISEFLETENGPEELAVYCESFDLVHVHSMYLEQREVLLAQKLDQPLLVTLHSRTAIGSIDFPLVCVSPKIAQDVTSRFPVYTIENGVEISTSPQNKGRLKSDSGLIFVRVCRPERSAPNFWPVMEKVLEQLPFATLWIIGQEGVNRNNVQFWGIRDDVDRLLALADIFVYFPTTHEPGAHDVCVLEAMAAGLPIVTTEVRGVSESVEHGKSALVFPPGADAALIEALISLGKDSERRACLGEAARCTAQERFSVERMSRCYEDVYREVQREWFDKRRA